MQKHIKFENISINLILNNFILTTIFGLILNFSIISPSRLCYYLQHEYYTFLVKRVILFVLLFLILIVENFILRWMLKKMNYRVEGLVRIIKISFFFLLMFLLVNLYSIITYDCSNVIIE